jgi:hypothetical protein
VAPEQPIGGRDPLVIDGLLGHRSPPLEFSRALAGIGALTLIRNLAN